MTPRSWLFVPGNSETKLAAAAATGAHAIVVDLEDTVLAHEKPAARNLARQWLEAHRHNVLEGRHMARWVRINAIETGQWQDDLAAVMPGAPDGILLPRAENPEQVRQVAAELYELEQRNRIPNGTTRILPLVSQSPRAALTMGDYADVSMPRLAGLAWTPAPLGAALGATRERDGQGQWTDTFRFVRAQMLLVAHARGIWSIDTFHEDFRDEPATAAAAQAARADGFAGMLAIHPAQVPIINAAFAPTADELAHAQDVVGAFAGNPQAVAVPLGGRMVDRQHLALARQVLGLD